MKSAKLSKARRGSVIGSDVLARDAEEGDAVWQPLEPRIFDPFEPEGAVTRGVGHGFARQDVARLCDVRDPRRQVDGLSEDVEVTLDHRSRMDPTTRRQSAFATHRLHEVEGGADADRRIPESQHRSIT